MQSWGTCMEAESLAGGANQLKAALAVFWEPGEHPGQGQTLHTLARVLVSSGRPREAIPKGHMVVVGRRLSLHLPSARRSAARDGAKQAGTPRDG